MLLPAGVHPMIVSERLGHASIRITLDVYSRVLPGMQDEATAPIERMLYGHETRANISQRYPRFIRSDTGIRNSHVLTLNFSLRTLYAHKFLKREFWTVT
jgi:hypothetical protein